MSTTDSRPDHDSSPLLGLGSSDVLGPLPLLVGCPFCGASQGYTLRDGDTYRWWLVMCAGCGAGVAECRSDGRTQMNAPKPARWQAADDEWNAAGAHAQRLRDALIPLANAHTPIEREYLTDEDCRRAQAALYGPNAEVSR